MQVTANPTTEACQEWRQEKSNLLNRWLQVLGGVIDCTDKECGLCRLAGMWHGERAANERRAKDAIVRCG